MPSNRDRSPSLEYEHRAGERGFRYLIGCDEVGRGAIAGPVAVGAAIVVCGVTDFPERLRDSKLLTEKRRTAIYEDIRSWVSGYAVGMASAAEIDQHGITAMLGEAARRALLGLHAQGFAVAEALVVLDGSHDWLSPALRSPLTVETLVKADQQCATVAAASVLAKVERDALMRELHETHEQYGWASNKGYGSASHYAAIKQYGISEWHRASWIRA